MIAFSQLLAPGDTVIEVGGHIGYIAMWLATLIGSSGRIIVCEPGSNNLPYLEKNLTPYDWATVLDVAITEDAGVREFMEEKFTGQNNSLRIDHGQFEKTMKLNRMRVRSSIRNVNTLSLDEVVRGLVRRPSLIKIDVEGGELDVLRGARKTLNTDAPAVVIEIAFDHDEAETILTDAGYIVLDPRLRPIGHVRDRTLSNYVCLHEKQHATLLRRLELL